MNLFHSWVNFINKSATGSSRLRWITVPFGILVFLFWVAVYIVAALWTDSYLSLPEFFLYPWNYLIGIPLLVLGTYIATYCSLVFVKARGIPLWSNPPPKLVSHGPYAKTRNPMISGIFLMMFGLGAIIQSISLFFVFTPLFFLSYYIELTKVEEPELSRRMGDEYLEYKSRVPMFIPRFVRNKAVTPLEIRLAQESKPADE